MGSTIYLKKISHDKFEELLGQYETHLRETDRGSSIRSYLGDIRRFSGWMAGLYDVFNPAAISPLDMVQYRQHLQDKQKTPATVNRALISLKLFFAWLVKQEAIKNNPAEDIKPVAEGARLAPKWLDGNQQAALMREVREGGSTRDEAIIGIMLHAGLRISEVCALQRGDLYIGDRAGKVIVRQGKGNKHREVPLNKTIRKILSRWMEENPKGPLFPNLRNGGPITSNGVYKHLIEYAYQVKLPELTPHSLRHTFCKSAIDRGIPIDQVAMMAGHSSLDVTKRYTAPSMEDLQGAVERMAWE
ncbi:MAG: integrase [Peptococcaceae bacterium BICA1-7]|nr:MAG: integrase [Peptococcaceae bacterium BICA1-7]HBV97357.1 integrase [Desulfotomaculum sp.]